MRKSNPFCFLAAFFGCLLVVLVGQPVTLMAQSNEGISVSSMTIFVVRHAEKDTLDKANPVLSALGEARARDLCRFLGSQTPLHVFSTNTRRTLQTAACLGLPPQLYDARQLPALVERVRAVAGQGPVLVVGHSNTVLETIEAFTGQKPLPRLDDEDYDYLFELQFKEGKWQVLTKQYGAAHRSKPGQVQRMH